MKIYEHKMLSLSIRKEILENDNSLVVISLSKVSENEFLQPLKPIWKGELSYCHYLEMLKLKATICIFFARRDVQKLTYLSAKFQEDPVEPLREITFRSYGIWRTSQFWSCEEMLVKNWV